MKNRVVLLALTIVLSAFTTTRTVHCAAEYYSKSVPYNRPHEKKTNLRFFIHDILSGENPSAVLIAKPSSNKNDSNPTPFGATFAFDDILTEGPEPTSKVIGNAKGLYVSASRDPKTFTIVMYIDLGFTTGKFNGSSISVFSRNPVTEERRELAVVGGRGRFRYARGFVLVKTQYFNATNGDAVLEYNAEIIHP